MLEWLLQVQGVCGNALKVSRCASTQPLKSNALIYNERLDESICSSAVRPVNTWRGAESAHRRQQNHMRRCAWRALRCCLAFYEQGGVARHVPDEWLPGYGGGEDDVN